VSAEGAQLNVRPFPATAAAEGAQLNAPPSLWERGRIEKHQAIPGKPTASSPDTLLQAS